MKHIHLDLHVNMHVIGTIIVSSLTIVSIAALEYVHLNSALTYEKEAIYAQFQNNAHDKEANSSNSIKELWKFEVYSDEVNLTSAKELSAETVAQKAKMKKAFVNILKNNSWSQVVKKIETLTSEQKITILSRIDIKIEQIESLNNTDWKMDKRLWQLLAARELFVSQ